MLLSRRPGYGRGLGQETQCVGQSARGHRRHSGLILWFVQMRKAPTNLLQRRDCERAYADARTASDTATVDQRRPVLGQSTDTLTCGAFRRAGRLR